MSADVRIFIDSECKNEILTDDLSKYILILTNGLALNGYTGQVINVGLYVKNCGDRAALHTSIKTLNSDVSYITIQSKGSYEDKTSYLFGDIYATEIVPTIFKINIPMRTPIGTVASYMYLDYYTLPDADNTYYNPYTNTACDYCDLFKSSNAFIVPGGIGATLSLTNGDFYIQVGEETYKLNNANFKLEPCTPTGGL